MGNLHGWVKYMEICFKWIRNTWLQCSVKFSSHVSMFQQFSKKLLISSCCHHGILKNNNLLPNHQIFFCAIWNQKYFSITVLRLRGWLLMTPWHGSICFIRKRKYGWFLHKGLLLDWLISLLYLLQSVCWSEYSTKATNFPILNLFLHFLHSLVFKYFRIFITAMRSKFHCLLKFSTGELRNEFYWICHVAFCLHVLVCWRLTVSK